MPESTDIAHYDPNPPPAPTTSGSVLGNIMALAKDPTVDATKIETLTNLAIKLQDRELRAEFSRDKIAAIREMPAIYKRGQSDKHRYAKFEDLHRACMPILAKHHLTIDFRVGNEGKQITCQPILRHENGHIEEGGVMKGDPDTGPGRSPIQAVGSATSYLKRHSLKAMLNIIEDGEDNDGVGWRETDQKNDRQERLIVDAEANAGGGYDAWYKALPAKDRGYLVRTGVHARLGGGVLLPGAASSPVGRGDRQEPEDAEFEPSQAEPREPARQASSPEPAQDPEPEPDRSTAEGWTTIYERECGAATSIEQLADIQTKGAKALRRLADEAPKLWERADAAMLAARERLTGDDSFPGDR